MSAPAKEPQPLGSTSGKRGYIRACVRCGVTLYGVGRRAMYCPECRRLVSNERARERQRRCKAKAQADAAGMTYGQYVARGCLTNRPKATAEAHPRDDAQPPLLPAVRGRDRRPQTGPKVLRRMPPYRQGYADSGVCA